MVLRYIKRYILVLLLPVIRSLLNFGTGGVISKLILGELVLSIIIIAIAVIRWKQYRIVVYNGYLRVSHGIFIKKIAVIPLNKISGLYVYKSPFYSMFGAARVTIDTDAGYKKKSDFDFYFSTKNLPYLTVAVSPCHKGIRKYNCTVWQSFALAVSNASALTGVLVFATAINYAGKIFDENVVNDTIINTITLYTAIMNKFLPPATSFVALVIFIGFAISFLLTLLKYLRFSIRKSDEGISVEQGLLIRKNSYINQKEIAATVIKQPPLLRFIKRCSILIYSAGYGKYKNESNELVPVEKHSDINSSLMLMGLRQQSENLTLKPPARVFSRIIFMPTVYLFAVVALSMILILKYPTYSPVFIIFSAFIILIIVYFIYIRYKYFKTGGATLRNGIRACTTSYLNLTDAQFEPDKIDVITVIQGPFDRRHKVCTLQIVSRTESKFHVKSRNLDLKQTLKEIRDVFNR